ncbi:DegV family protein with EDD domain [Stackebrandtia endophytica]|uniref:DegV family protein with EDD domain n=1 Tax=Stackebrandtia endophytica TaxID=1496996 RepID=A0A543B0R1_9ACTN|nr:DegV family protein [Stackebrandtia endophytica]TQL78376.1 DegV family protein with EDD domain [Stackebrandtia endophytica]
MSVAVVTDSTACLPPDIASRYRVSVVPMPVTVNGISGREGVDVTSEDVQAALGERRVDVSTSRPAPAELARRYRQLLDTGSAAVVSIHLSGELSGTCDAARLAAAEFGDKVIVVDSRNTGMGLGFAVIEAAKAAKRGRGRGQVAMLARQTAEATRTFFYVDTLEFLRRGGRMGAAQALLGTALSVKPLLHVSEGKVEVREKVRTTTRALAKLEDLAVTAGREGSVDIALHHLGAPEAAQRLADRLAERFGRRLRHTYISEVGAVLAAHCGPGLLGVVVNRRLE